MTIQDILEAHGVPFAGPGHKHGRLGWVQVDCPYCGNETGKFHLGISLSSGASSCWHCGKHNTAIVLAMLTGKNSLAMRKAVDDAALVAAPTRHTGRLVLPTGRGPLLGGHCTYLARRGYYAGSVAALWGVQGIGQASGQWRHLRWRLFIPVHHYGEVVSWTTRTINPKEKQRYISASGEQEAIPHKSILYGADYARHAIIIHEGPLDVWATGPGAVATCGTAYTDAQVLAMRGYPVRVVCFDSSADAQARGKELAATLAAYPGHTYNVKLETGEDAADANPEELAELRKFLG